MRIQYSLIVARLSPHKLATHHPGWQEHAAKAGNASSKGHGLLFNFWT